MPYPTDKLAFRSNDGGFTLVELLIVVCVGCLIAALAVSRLYSSGKEVGGAERVLEEAAAKVTARRSEAVRLNGQDRRRGLLQDVSADPVPIDFGSLELTASLRVDGADNDGDCRDDQTGGGLTCLSIAHGRGVWQMALNDDGLRLPDEWTVLTNPLEVSVPLIGNGSRGQGVLVTQLGFDGEGRAFAKMPGTEDWVSVPEGAASSTEPSQGEAPFWAVYFVKVKRGSARVAGKNVSSDVSAAVAIAVHPTGLVERFRYDGERWIGYQNRVVE